MVNKVLNLGTKTKYGKIVAIMWLGERYYMCSRYRGKLTSLIPGSILEKEENAMSHEEFLGRCQQLGMSP